MDEGDEADMGDETPVQDPQEEPFEWLIETVLSMSHVRPENFNPDQIRKFL